ncbi:MAG: mannonate dehydratase [Thermomicrobiales bacterium]|nr:mannonate dehydratase [Thermomicrobiales bacterium]
MKLGLGLYRHMLTPDNFRFARQTGATHIVAHFTDYFAEGPRIPQSESEGQGWGVTANQERLWTAEELTALRSAVEAEGLQLAALENFDPSHWHDVLLDGPLRDKQIEDVKTLVRNIGAAGIPVMGYNFSIAGVWGHVVGPWARGGAESVGFLGPDGPRETPIPNGQVWNMTYDPHAPAGSIPPISSEQLWDRFGRFLQEIVPVAEEAGVRMALHPDDPPMPSLRGYARLVHKPEHYQRVLDLVPSRYNALEFCQGTIAEMRGEMDVYQAVDRYSKQDAIGYVHFRNVKGKVPRYHEVFVDEGDVDMIECLRIYHRNGYDGVIIPDHTPQMTCAASWHAGMAYALGWMRAVVTMIERESAA